MQYDFNPGDRVRFRSWDDMKEEFGLDSYERYIDCRFQFVEDMRDLCGKEYTIDWIDADGEVGLESFDEPYTISTDMIEPVNCDQGELPDVSLDDLMGVLDQ